MSEIERYQFDVVVIGAGGAGLRAAIEAREGGATCAVLSKSLFGKAHTVMAEGGIAASMANVNPKDGWDVHFCDTMRGGKFLNNYRMAELHAKEAPERVWELESWGALFDRTPEGKISQRNFGGHEYPRLAHVGDRTGLEMIRTLQQRIVALQQQDKKLTGDYESGLRVFAECTVTDVFMTGEGEDRHVSGVLAYWRSTGQFVVFETSAVIIATGGIGRSWNVTSNSWEYTGDGHALALLTGGSLINMECIQFHPTGMVWPLSVKGLLVTESVRGDGGVLTNSEGKRFMFDYVPEVFRSKYASTEAEADRWYTDPDNNLRPPELLPRDEVARAINSEVKAGRGSPHGGVFLDVSSRLPADVIRAKLPSMWHQFKELADVDITAEPMEVGPTCHYVMGGVEVNADTQELVGVKGIYSAGEASGGMHGSNRLGGNSLSDLLVFGRRAGLYAAEYVNGLPEQPKLLEAEIEAAIEVALAPYGEDRTENPFTIQAELQSVMGDLVGIIRTASEMEEALVRLEGLKQRARIAKATGGREYNPGWHLALDLQKQLLISECVAKAAIAREESRGGHTRDDFPGMDPEWRKVNLVCTLDDGAIDIKKQALPTIPLDLLSLFDVSELKKYMTAEELVSMTQGTA
ncbi:MAG: fumarate reductase/succinate dehydrogenase flavoprotein subunit [bacterium]|nr:fumarate reductase/succinate dehydrogenase flavoprotein subunit [bacterium]